MNTNGLVAAPALAGGVLGAHTVAQLPPQSPGRAAAQAMLATTGISVGLLVVLAVLLLVVGTGFRIAGRARA